MFKRSVSLMAALVILFSAVPALAGSVGKYFSDGIGIVHQGNDWYFLDENGVKVF